MATDEGFTSITATLDDSDTTNNNNSTYDYLSHEQQVILHAVTTVSIALSFFGSGSILVLLLRARKLSLDERLYHRLVAGLSIMDFIVTLSIAATIFTRPATTGLLYARGTTATCSATGFFFLFFIGGTTYNFFLSMYFCLMITYGWQEAKIQKTMEPWVHLIAFLLPIVASVTALSQEMINPDPITTGTCNLNPYPADCLLTDTVECQRGSSDSRLRSFLTALTLLLALCGVYFTIRVFVSVRRQTRTTLRYSLSEELTPSQARRIRSVGQQAVLYTAAFLNSFVAVIINAVMRGVLFSDIESTKELEDKPGIFPALVFIYSTFPLQGFWNFLVYTRPRVLQWKQSDQGRSWFWAFRMVLSGQPTPSAGRESSGQDAPAMISVDAPPPEEGDIEIVEMT